VRQVHLLIIDLFTLSAEGEFLPIEPHVPNASTTTKSRDKCGTTYRPGS